MLKLKIIVAAIAPIFMLASCATMAPHATEPTRSSLGRYQFEYAVPERRAVDLIQVFDDGTNTFLQFNKLSMPIVVTANDRPAPLAYTRQGLYLTIPGVYASLKIKTRGRVAQITNQATPANLPPASARPTAQDSTLTTPLSLVPSTQLTPQDAILADTASRSNVKPKLPEATTAAAAPEIARAVTPATFRVPFSGDSLTVGAKARAVIDAAASAAVSAPAVTLYGRAIKGETEGLALAQKLALRRAWAIMANLVRRGTDPGKFRLFYSGKKSINAVEIAIAAPQHKV